MKILMTSDAVGGVWTYTVELTRAMSAHRFVLAVMGPAPSDAQRAELPDNVRLFERDCKLEWMSEPWKDVALAGEWLLELEGKESPDLIHLNGYAHAALPFRAPKLVVGHSCVFSWWRAVHGSDPPDEWEIYRCAVQRGLNAATFVVAPSKSMLSALHEHYSFDGPDRVIYNGRTGQPEDLTNPQPSVFSAGRLWDEAKNLNTVVEAARWIHAPVRVAGDGGHSSTNVTYLGRLDRVGMIRALGEASVALFPAVYEPFGLSILEAALAGCALVIGNIPSLREIWEDTAIFVPPRDPAAIAGAVNALLADGTLRDELSRRARKRAAQFNPARMAIEYEDVYRSMVAGIRPAFGNISAQLQSADENRVLRQ